MKKKWMLLFLFRSMSQRKGRVIVASLSVTLAVSIISGMIGITEGINEKLGSELKAYGANIIVSPAEGGYLTSDLVNEVLGIENVTDAEGQLFGTALLYESASDFIGVDMKGLKGKGWKYEGTWPDKRKEILAGINLKRALNLDEGSEIFLAPSLTEDRGEQKRIKFIVSGFIERGSSEDNAFILSMEDAWELSGREGRLSAVLVRADPDAIDNVVSSMKQQFPFTEVKTFRQVAYAEQSLLGKIQLLMALVTIVVLLAAVISVGSTMGANVLERREEIGLMMALGATKNMINSIYALEAALMGLAGGCAGFVLGYLSTQAISSGAFGSGISMPFYIVFLSVINGLIIALLSSYFPVRDALKYKPAEILRGE
jgi:putative ABC transport system permease protein